MKRPSILVDHWTGEANAILQSVTTAAAGWLAPLPEAVMTARAIAKVFVLPTFLSYVVAASIELVGIGVNAHYANVREFNDRQEWLVNKYSMKRGPRHPLEDARAARRRVVAFYVTTGLIVAMSAIAEAFERATILPLLAILFPVASAIGTISMNERAAFHRKLARIAEEESEGKEVTHKPEAQEVPQEAEEEAAPLLKQVSAKPEASQALPEYAAETVRFFAGNPRATYKEAAETLGVTTRTVGSHMRLAEEMGIAGRNGNGWKVEVSE